MSVDLKTQKVFKSVSISVNTIDLSYKKSYLEYLKFIQKKT